MAFSRQFGPWIRHPSARPLGFVYHITFSSTSTSSRHCIVDLSRGQHFHQHGGVAAVLWCMPLRQSQRGMGWLIFHNILRSRECSSWTPSCRQAHLGAADDRHHLPFRGLSHHTNQCTNFIRTTDSVRSDIHRTWHTLLCRIKMIPIPGSRNAVGGNKRFTPALGSGLHGLPGISGGWGTDRARQFCREKNDGNICGGYHDTRVR